MRNMSFYYFGTICEDKIKLMGHFCRSITREQHKMADIPWNMTMDFKTEGDWSLTVANKERKYSLLLVQISYTQFDVHTRNRYC